MTTAHAVESRVGASALQRLASAVGIIDSYVDQTGREVRETSDQTRRALLAAMSIDASTEAAAQASLDALRAEARAQLIEPTRVVEVTDSSRRLLAVRAPASRHRSGPWRLEVESEDGEVRRSDGPWRGDTELEVTLPDLPPGYHHIRLTLSASADEWASEQTLIIVPSRCTSPDELLGDDDAFGIVANLYTVRSGRNWGIGDLTDLSALGDWAAAEGADFLGLSPLHALRNRDGDISPYNPVSRLYRNPIYIDIERIPELANAGSLRDRISSPDMRAELDALRDAPFIRYDDIIAAKRTALDALHRVFGEQARGSSVGGERARAYAEFVAREGDALSDFALWMTLAELPEYGPDWRAWPIELRDPHGTAARRLAERHAERVELHRWLQFEIDRQLGETARRTRGAGMRIGLYNDLAIGSSPGGADTWANQELFVATASVGAPPDPYAAAGQNWQFPPIEPAALRASGYRYFVDLLRAALRHAGALRIDHVLGLFRLFWIPNDDTESAGAYVRYPTADLLGIVALESVRHRALVIGEDLGTVPPEVAPALEKWGILSSRVLEFERDARGAFRRAGDYPPLSLATANTHDLAPIDGFWNGRDIELRRDAGLIADDGAAACARSSRERERVALVELLASEGVLPTPSAPESGAALRAAVHAFLCRTPSRLVGLSLDDLSGETEPVNLPGTTREQFPSWTRKMKRTLESLTTSEDVRAAIPCHARRRPSAARAGPASGERFH